MALATKTDEREILFYSVIAPDLIEVVPSLQKHLCFCYTTQVIKENPDTGISRNSMLVLEDLKQTGFKMMDMSGSENIGIIKNLISFMAQLHFAAYSVAMKNEKSLAELCPFLQGIHPNPSWEQEVETIFERAYPNFENLFKQHDLEHVYKEYAKLKPFTRKIAQKVEQNGKKTRCLVHADVWPPNIMAHEKLPKLSTGSGWVTKT